MRDVLRLLQVRGPNGDHSNSSHSSTGADVYGTHGTLHGSSPSKHGTAASSSSATRETSLGSGAGNGSATSTSRRAMRNHVYVGSGTASDAAPGESNRKQTSRTCVAVHCSSLYFAATKSRTKNRARC